MFDYGTSQDWVWDGSRKVVQFTVADGATGKQILCRISEECIMDHFGGPPTDAACLEAARERFDEITDLAAHLIAMKRFERDGTILIRSLDWRRER